MIVGKDRDKKTAERAMVGVGTGQLSYSPAPARQNHGGRLEKVRWKQETARGAETVFCSVRLMGIPHLAEPLCGNVSYPFSFYNTLWRMNAFRGPRWCRPN